MQAPRRSLRGSALVLRESLRIKIVAMQKAVGDTLRHRPFFWVALTFPESLGGCAALLQGWFGSLLTDCKG